MGTAAQEGNRFVVRPDGTKLFYSLSGEPELNLKADVSSGWAYGAYNADNVLVSALVKAGSYYINNCIPGHPLDGTCVPNQQPSGVSTGSTCWGALTAQDAVCCHADGTCTIETAATCNAQGDTFIAAEQKCWPGRCSAARGTCCIGAPTYDQCATVGGVDYCPGVWTYTGASCEYCFGACCDTSNSQCSSVSNRNCTGPNLSYLGDASSCQGCNIGGCCDTNGNCVVSPAGNCLPPSIFTGSGNNCQAANPCLPPSQYTAKGACCFGSTCAITSSAPACNGVFQGTGTTCTSSTCFIGGDGLGSNTGTASGTVTRTTTVPNNGAKESSSSQIDF